MEFLDKTVAITGAGSGIGRALAQNLDAQGAHLALSDIDAAALAATANSLSRPPMSTVLDVANREAFYAYAQQVEETLGAAHLVINNAGVAVSQTMADIEYDDFEWIMNINFWGMVYGSKAFLPQLLSHKQSALVNVSSIFGLFSVPTQGAYNASKFAIRGFTEALRLEMANTNLTVHSVHPGGIRTNIARNARFHIGPANTDAATGQDMFDKIARTNPEEAAQVILRGVQNKQVRILIGSDARALDLLQRVMPASYGKLISITDRIGRKIQPKFALRSTS